MEFLTLPWEQHVFDGSVTFSRSLRPRIGALPFAPTPHQPFSCPGPDLVVGTFHEDVPVSIFDLQLSNSQRDVAISRFYLLLGRYTARCTLSDQACQSTGWLSLCTLQDALACKASTLVTRSLALQKFHDWCIDSQQQFLPFSEPVVYQYCHTLASGAASAPMSALQAIRFAIAHCGCAHDSNLLPSCRIAGICQSRAVARPPKKQADSLTLDAIRILEGATCQASHV